MNRLTSHDPYFLTICIQSKLHWFGEIQNGKMKLSNFGKIIHNEWYKSFEIRTELFADEFVVMPNHIHGIVFLKSNDEIDDTVEPNGTVETHDRASLQKNHTHSSLRKNQRKPKSISSFVAGFKSATVREIDNLIDSNNLKIEKFNRNNLLWQRNYWDKIIRNEKEYNHIAEYILTNPENWEKDELYGLTDEEIGIVENVS